MFRLGVVFHPVLTPVSPRISNLKPQQLATHGVTFNPGVVGSNPTGPSTLLPYLMQVGRSGRFLESRKSSPGVLLLWRNAQSIVEHTMEVVRHNRGLSGEDRATPGGFTQAGKAVCGC